MNIILIFMLSALSVRALQSGADYYPWIRDGSAVGYVYTDEDCQAPTTTDRSGNVWNFVDLLSINDGLTIFEAPLFRRDDIQEFIMFFPGSKPLANYIQGALIVPVDYPYCEGCQVGFGFYQAWTTSRDAVVNLIRANLIGDYVDYNVTVAGYSYGAAISALAFAEFKANRTIDLRDRTHHGFSLGEPRVGNFNFARWFNTLTGASPTQVGSWLRVTHGYDSVARSPAVLHYDIDQTPDFSYQHHGTEIWEFNDAKNGNHPSAATTYICYMRSDQSESTNCSTNPSEFSSIEDHTTYAGFNDSRPWQDVKCGAQ